MTSYDTHQRDAVLRTCAWCRGTFYVTHADTVPAPFVCTTCRDRLAKVDESR